MKHFVLAVVLFAFCACANAALNFDNSVLEESVLEGAKHVDFYFKFTNSSDEKIAIKNMRVSCGCLTTSADKKEYAPNENGEIKVRFDIGDRVGEQFKDVFIKTDDAEQKEIKLSVKLNIIQWGIVKPKILFWHMGSNANTQEAVLKLSPQANCELKNIESPSSDFKVEHSEKSKGEYLIKVTPLSVKKSASGKITITLANKSGEKRTNDIHAMIR